MNNYTKSFAKILAFLGLAFVLQACNEPMMLEEITPTTGPVNALSTVECAGSIDYAVCHSVISQGLNANQVFDIVIQVDTSRWARLPSDCDCRVKKYCVTLDFPPRVVRQAAKSSIDGPFEDYITLESDGMGSYVGFENPLKLGPQGQNSIPPQDSIHEICFEAGDQAMFSLDSAFLANYDLSRAVIRAGGLCIVADIHNPRIFDDNMYTACSN